VKLRRAIVARVLLVVLVAGSLVAVASGPASAGTRTPRNCASYVDGAWKLDVCSGGYYIDSTHARAAVDMHTYHWNSNCGDGSGCWQDSQSQSITMNDSQVWYNPNIWYPYFDWGQNYGAQCRVNDPAAGTVTCSVPNAVRVTFYSKAFTRQPHTVYSNVIHYVSWRDASGQAHYPPHVGLASPNF